MKKIIFLGAFALLALASCKKDYTCKCTSTDGSNTYTSSSTITDHRSDAKAECDAKDTSAGTASINCEIE